MPKFSASILVDSLLSFLTIMLITTIFIPILLKLTLSLDNEYKKLEMKQAIITSTNHYKKEDLLKGIRLGKYDIKLFKNSICNDDLSLNKKICIKY
ncbi:hypothetical protein [Staphylococcus devriesei]|uniref:Uncharacterized protein n=1 Tax=Staphylococcus devriesei TaxID=586733 RepID=A0A2K4DGV8_9STAP|nr:hypothetical protein [Staphylococcus devriesei]MCE5097460.1 hypothetical protein [Staphylococcus devriesei]PNZ86086.1 hypothetical protein CD147_10585 [Staphylococcus devriesei]PTF02158.1 hypothetical protein BUY45_10660 [Staphylococcus devriesei]PTF12251.1 hypothetical protein BUY48_09745 [Staphylococcus devriesei]PTF15468.1 hypothetical protein BUY47_01445 [Staphylococcus devriesei]